MKKQIQLNGYYDNNYALTMICKVIEQAKSAPFWRKKIGTHIVRSMEEFRQLPLTTRDEINALYDNDNWDEILTATTEKKYITVTSGGRPYRHPFISCLRKKEFKDMSNTIANMFLINGIKGGTILITFPGTLPYPLRFAKNIWPEKDLQEYQSAHISGAVFKNASIAYNLNTYCTGLRFLAYKVSKKEAESDRDRIMKAYTMVKPEILAVSPNVLRNIFFPVLKKLGHKFSEYNTRIIISGGEKLNDSDYKQIQQMGNPRIIVWIESGEIGTIGYTKSFLAPQSKSNYYYTSWPQNYFETVDEKGLPLPFGTRGRIVVTRLTTFLQPLIRYDLEDEGRFYIHENELVLEQDILKL